MPAASQSTFEIDAKVVAQYQSHATNVADGDAGIVSPMAEHMMGVDLSHYTGGAPLIPTADKTNAKTEAKTEEKSADIENDMVYTIVDHGVGSTQELVGKSLKMDEKKIGRPSHPAWQYFERGEKRNRFHYNAYCRFCQEKGSNPVAVRGVSGNMIRHLQKCIYCPVEVVNLLKLLCVQKDVANFNKRHQSQNRNDDTVFPETSPILKKAKHNESPDDLNKLQISDYKVKDNDMMALQLPMLADGLMDSSPQTTKNKFQTAQQVNNDQSQSSEIVANVLSKLVVSSTLSTNLPWDWMWTEQSALMFGNLHVELPNSTLFSEIGKSSHENQILKMKNEQSGVTLAINWWAAKYPRSSFVLLSLVNARGEATPWELIDMGIKDCTPESLSETINYNLIKIRKSGVNVINIVADTSLAYVASRLAVNSNEWIKLGIPVLPCFSQLLQILLGFVLTVSDEWIQTIGDLIELVRIFSDDRVLKVFRRECGDSHAMLHVVTSNNWYSFIEAVDSVRQYEDIIKFISSKVVQAMSTTSLGYNKSKTANPRKDSAGNTKEELVECRFSNSIVRIIQNTDFWENITAISELMAPIKETSKMMRNLASSFSVSDISYQFGRMQQAYANILSDWEDAHGGGRSTDHVSCLLQKLNDMWKINDQPLLILGYTFNYNLQHQFLSTCQPSLRWLSIVKCAKQYFRNWFCAASTQDSLHCFVLGEETVAEFVEDIVAFKERKDPFDSVSTSDFDNPTHFYKLISDTHPLLHLFGSRLFSFVTSTPPLGKILSGKSFIPSVPSTTCPQQTLLPLLRLKLFEHTSARPSLRFAQTNKFKNSTGMKGGLTDQEPFSCHQKLSSTERGESNDKLHELEKIWSKKQWMALANEWKTHCEKECNSFNLGLKSSEHNLITPNNVPLDQIFNEKLPSRLPHSQDDAIVDV